MTRQSPNYHDDPRLETDSSLYDTPKTVTESDRRITRRGADEVRIATGGIAVHSPESKAEFTSVRAIQLEQMINNANLTDPKIKQAARRMIELAESHSQISSQERDGLIYHLEHAEGFDDSRGRPPDQQESAIPDF